MPKEKKKKSKEKVAKKKKMSMKDIAFRYSVYNALRQAFKNGNDMSQLPSEEVALDLCRFNKHGIDFGKTKPEKLLQHIDKWKEETADRPTDNEVRSAFQHTAEAIGGDVFQACRDCNEPPVLHRETIYDYIDMHGGDSGKTSRWVMSPLYSLEDLEKELDRMQVPRTWT